MRKLFLVIGAMVVAVLVWLAMRDRGVDLEDDTRVRAPDDMYSSERPPSAGAPDAHVAVPLAELYVPNPVEAPDFALATLDSEPFRLSDQRGRIVALNFWATWCGPCRIEIPDFVQLQEEMEGDVVFVGVSLDEEASSDDLRAFARDLGVNYPMMLDDGTARDLYGPIASLPTTFVIDRDGMVQSYLPGMITRELLRPLLVDLFDGRGDG